MNRTQDGRPEIRQACYADHGALRDFLCGLSLRARYLRFFTGAVAATPAMLRVLAGGSDQIDAIVAVEGGAIVGHAMASDATGPGGGTVTEIGVVVTDACQGRGIGSALIRALTARALARGITAATMDVLAENRPVLAMIADHWPTAQHDLSGAYATIQVPLPQPASIDREPTARGADWTEERRPRRGNGEAGGAPEASEERAPLASQRGAVVPGLRSEGARNERLSDEGRRRLLGAPEASEERGGRPRERLAIRY